MTIKFIYQVAKTEQLVSPSSASAGIQNEACLNDGNFGAKYILPGATTVLGAIGLQMRISLAL